LLFVALGGLERGARLRCTACRSFHRCLRALDRELGGPLDQLLVGVGLPAGHSGAPAQVENHILPLGIAVELDTDRGRLVSLEAAVA